MEADGAKVVRRFEILAIVGSVFLFAGAYLFYNILQYIDAVTGNGLPTGTIFVLPTIEAVTYSLVIAVGFVCIGVGHTQLVSWNRELQIKEKPELVLTTVPESVGNAVSIGIYVVDFLGSLFFVIFSSYGNSVVSSSVFNSSSWQAGLTAWFSGIPITLAIVPATAVFLFMTLRAAFKRVKQNTGSATGFVVSDIIAGTSLLSMAVPVAATILLH